MTIRVVDLAGTPFLVCGCGVYRLESVAGIGWSKAGGTVEVYLRDVEPGSRPAWAGREDLDAFAASLKPKDAK